MDEETAKQLIAKGEREYESMLQSVPLQWIAKRHGNDYTVYELADGNCMAFHYEDILLDAIHEDGRWEKRLEFTKDHLQMII